MVTDTREKDLAAYDRQGEQNSCYIQRHTNVYQASPSSTSEA